MAEDGLNEKLLIRRKHHEGSNSDHHKSSISRLQLSLKQVAILLAAYLALGTICFYLIRDQISGTKTNGIIDSEQNPMRKSVIEHQLKPNIQHHQKPIANLQYTNPLLIQNNNNKSSLKPWPKRSS